MTEQICVFRKKPVEILAFQVMMDNMGYLASWCNGVVENESIKIQTLEGEMTANQGDWIIQGVKGEFYPCKPDIFAATYDPVPDTWEDPYKVDVTDIVDQDDGSAVMSLELGREALKALAQIGLLKVVKEAAEQQLAYSEGGAS